MKIAFVHNTAPGGSKRAAYEHVRGLVERGHEINAFVPVEACEDYLPLRPLCTTYREYGERSDSVPARNALTDRESGLRQMAQQLLGPDVNDLVRDYFWTKRQAHLADSLGERYRQMAADIDASECEVLFVHQCNSLLAPDVLSAVQRIPTVFYVQDTHRRFHEWPTQPVEGYDSFKETFARQKRRGKVLSPLLQQWGEREDTRAVLNLRSAHRVLVNSYYSREGFLRTAGIDTQVCYLGVDTDYFAPDPRVTRKREVLSVGALRAEKRHEFVIDAIASIPEAVRPPLRIIGYGLSDGKGGRSTISQALFSRATTQKVQLTIDEEVTDETLRAGYRRAAVFAFAPYLEPFGLVVLEAMACGTPTVAIREAGPRETVQDGVTGFLTDYTPHHFGQAVAHLLSDRDIWQRISRAARAATITQWTWQYSVEKVEEVLEDVLRKKT